MEVYRNGDLELRRLLGEDTCGGGGPRQAGLVSALGRNILIWNQSSSRVMWVGEGRTAGATGQIIRRQ